MKKTIRIGRPNKEQFDSAYALIHRCASINQSLRGYYAESYNGTYRIGLNDTEYVYDDSLEIVARFDNADGKDADSQEEGRFLLEGASWFDGLRGGKRCGGRG